MSEPDSPPSPAKPRARKFSCDICAKAFTRSEHLARHQRSHWRHKPFTCPICHKSFGRQDALSRHAKQLHGITVNPDDTRMQLSASAFSGLFLEEGQSTFDASPSAVNGVSSVVDTVSPSAETSTQTDLKATMEPPMPWNGEDMLELLMSDVSSNWPVTLPVVPTKSFIDEISPLVASGQSTDVTVNPGYQAMQQMSRLILDLSFNISAEIDSTGITSAFLDTCIHVFFEKFIPSFPVLHKPTFSPKECSNPLLLNIFALGSLFVGNKDAIQKGEALWRLSHTAIATSWQALLAIRGPRDECNGIQLVLTALLGQIYAMLSKNENLRMTSQIFHGLGFYWARQSGMYNIHHVAADIIPSINADEGIKTEMWKTWAAREVQNRAVLGHYILDGQISQYSGFPVSVRHMTNPLLEPESDAAFAATTPNTWILEMQKPKPPRQSLREVFLQIFSPGQPNTEHTRSNFSVRLILEGLQSLASDMQEANGPAIGTPSTESVIKALVGLYNSRLKPCHYSVGDDMKLVIRWHAICLNIAAPIPVLCKKLCALYGIQQQLYPGDNMNMSEFNLREWSQSRAALRALLHAIAIQEILENMPIGISHAINLPAAIFSVATIYSARCLASLPTVTVPIHFCWEDVWSVDLLQTASDDRVLSSTEGVQKFLEGSLNKDEPNTSTRNFFYDLHSVELMLGSISARWGVSREMIEIIHHWMGFANQSD